MKSVTSISEPYIKYIYQLLDDIEKGELCVPKFQRGLVWDDEQRLDLLRSIKTGIPIGSLLVWNTSKYDLATFESIGGLPVPGRASGTATYLLDGHQRLATLFGALQRSEHMHNHDDEGKNWNIFYDLEEQDFILKRQPRKNSSLMPVNVLLDSLKLLKFLRTLGDNDELIQRADRLSKKFFSCKIAVVSIKTNDLELATTAFQRINSSNTPVNEVDMVVALSWVDKQFDLREKFNEAKEKLASVGWQNLEDKIILSACKARLDRKLINSDAEKTSEALKEQPEIITEITKNLIRVTQFLNQYCGIQSPQILPYQNQIVILAEAFRIQPEFNKEIQQQLQDWFWFTAYTELFNGIKENGIQEALDTVRAIVKAEKKDYRYSTTIEPLGKRFNFRAARAKLLLLRLAELEPIDFKGKSINVRALLSVHGKDAVLRLFNNNSAPENCFIFKPKQRFDFRDYLLKNNQWDTDFLQRHAISKSAAQALQQGNENEFLSERRQTLIEIEKAFIKPLGLDYHASAI